MRILLLSLLLPIQFALGQTNIFTDSRDGNNYPITQIGNALWFVENLQYQTDLIPIFSIMNRGASHFPPIENVSISGSKYYFSPEFKVSPEHPSSTNFSLLNVYPNYGKISWIETCAIRSSKRKTNGIVLMALGALIAGYGILLSNNDNKYSEAMISVGIGITIVGAINIISSKKQPSKPEEH